MPKRNALASTDSEPAATSVPTRIELPRRVVDLPIGPVSAGGPRHHPGGDTGHVLIGGGAFPRAEPNGRQLTVGTGIRLDGELGACDRLEVHGDVRLVLEHAALLEIGRSGRFEGRTVVESAEVAGCFRGELTVRGRLLVRASGVVEGVIRVGELEVERGGRLLGDVRVEDAPAVTSPAPAHTAV